MMNGKTVHQRLVVWWRVHGAENGFGKNSPQNERQVDGLLLDLAELPSAGFGGSAEQGRDGIGGASLELDDQQQI